MKKTIIHIFALASIFAAVSCSNDSLDNKSPKIGTMTFGVGELATRTEFSNPDASNSDILWQQNDSIGIYDNLELREFKINSINNASKNQATITGDADLNATDYYGIYPYNAFNAITGSAITFKIPTEQTATAGNFDPKANVSLAHAANGSSTMMFNNVGAWFKFKYSINKINAVNIYVNDSNYHSYLYSSITYTNPTITSFSITSDAPLSGKFSKSATDKNAALTTVEGNHSVSLKGTLNPSTNYLVCIPPLLAQNDSIKVHMNVNCTATKQLYNKEGPTGASTSYTTDVIGTRKTKVTSDFARNKVYNISYMNMELSPEFVYSKVTKVTGEDITWDGAYIAVGKYNNRYYVMNTTMADDVLTYFDKIDITAYYDQNTDKFYIPSDASVLSSNVVNLVMSGSGNTPTVNGHSTTLKVDPSDTNSYLFYVTYSSSNKQYIYFNSGRLGDEWFRFTMTSATSYGVLNYYPFESNNTTLRYFAHYFNLYKLEVTF